MTRVKLTGSTRTADAEAAVELGIDVLAWVFYARSPRYVTAARVWEMRRLLPPHVARHGVFVDTPPPLVQRVVDQLSLDAAQLFGAESRQDVESITPHAYKGVTVASAAECEVAGRAFGARRGRRGDPGLLVHLAHDRTRSWRELAAIARKLPLVVGVPSADEDTIYRLVRDVRPWAIDVWEAVETEPGRLDASRLAAVVAAVRAADAEADGGLPTVNRPTGSG